MKIFAIGDPHLSFGEGVQKPMDIFGGAWNDHVNRIQERWLDLIGPEDHVILPGDMSWGLKLEEASTLLKAECSSTVSFSEIRLESYRYCQRTM